MAAGGIPRGTGRYRRLAVFNYGFRPFFLAAGLWPVIALAMWMASLHGWALPGAFGTLTWHAHEMLYGFVVAAAAGFLLTALPNWTGRLPVSGVPLAALALLWLAGRVAVTLPASMLAPWLAAAVDCAFLAVLLAVALREIARGRNWRNLPVAGALGLLLAGNVLTHLGAQGVIGDPWLGLRLGIATMVMLISLIGGRIVPSFTRNWLKKAGARRLPESFGHFDRLALAASAAGLLAWAARPEAAAAGVLLSLAGLLQAARLLRWHGWRAWPEPLVWSLHLAYAWLPVGMCLLGAGVLSAEIPASAALHALTAGAMGGMILAVATRATLGHTGRELRAGPATTAVYVLVALGALARVLAGLVTAAYFQVIALAAMLWAGAFLVFDLVYGPMLLRPRRDRRPG